MVPFCKHHIETDNRGMITINQVFKQFGDLVPAPGPTTIFGKALFVDVDDDDARVFSARQGQV
jgi:hypothetical protein